MTGDVYEKVVDSKYRHINLPKSNQIIFANDLHGDTSALEELLKSAKKGAVIDIRDISNHSSREEYFKKLGYEDGKKIIFDYLSTNLSKEEMEIFQVGSQIEQFGGIDEYVNAVKDQNPSVNEEQLKSQVNPVYEMFKKPKFSQKLEGLIKNRPGDVTKKLEEHQGKLQIANHLMDSLEIKAIKDVIGENKNDYKFIVGGDHEDLNFAELFKQAIGGNVYYADAVEKVCKVGSGKDQIKFVIPDNVNGLIPRSQGRVYGSNISQLYPGLASSEGLEEHLTREKLDAMSIGDLKKNSPYFRKIVGDGEVSNLDVVLAHFRPGSIEGSPYPNVVDPGVAYFTKSTPVVSGHIHKHDSGKTDLCDDFEQGVIASITKKNGTLEIKRLAIDFDSNKQIDYLTLGGYSTIDDMKKDIDALHKQEKEVLAKISSEDLDKKRVA